MRLEVQCGVEQESQVYAILRTHLGDHTWDSGANKVLTIFIVFDAECESEMMDAANVIERQLDAEVRIVR